MREWVRLGEELSTSSSWMVDIMPPKTDITDIQSVGDRELANMSNTRHNADNSKPITARDAVAVVLPSVTHSFILSLGWKAKAETLCDRHLRLLVAIFSDFVARGALHSLFGDQDAFRNDLSFFSRRFDVIC